jgi:hypothetical protein
MKGQVEAIGVTEQQVRAEDEVECTAAKWQVGQAARNVPLGMGPVIHHKCSASRTPRFKVIVGISEECPSILFGVRTHVPIATIGLLLSGQREFIGTSAFIGRITRRCITSSEVVLGSLKLDPLAFSSGENRRRR